MKLVTTVVFIIYSFYNARSVKDFIGKNLYSLGQVKNLEKFKLFSTQKGGKTVSKDVSQNFSKNQQTNQEENDSHHQNMININLKNYDEVIKECVKTRRSGMDMLSKLDFVEMLQELMFEDHDKVLLPLLILRLKEKEINRKKQDQKINLNEPSILAKKTTIFKNKSKVGPLNTQNGHPDEELREGSTAPHQKMGYQDAYSALISSKPKNGFKKAIKKLMLENVKSFFEPDQNHKKVINDDFGVQAIEEELENEKPNHDQNFKRNHSTDRWGELEKEEDRSEKREPSKMRQGSLLNLLASRPTKKKKYKKMVLSSSGRIRLSEQQLSQARKGVNRPLPAGYDSLKNLNQNN